jgi:hypothetical protein
MTALSFQLGDDNYRDDNIVFVESKKRPGVGQ